MQEAGLELIVVDREPEASAPLRAAFDEVLRPSFSSDELPGWDEFVAEVGGDAGDVAYLAVREGAVLGAALCGRPEPGELALLSYLAARPGQRGGGIGGFLLRAMEEHWQTGGAALVLAEVHDPRAHPETEDERALARVRFYDRHGAVVLAPWVQPALGAGDRVTGMLLLALHRGADVPAGLLRQWAEGYFWWAEGEVPAEPWFVELAERLEAVDPTGARPAASFAEIAPLARTS